MIKITFIGAGSTIFAKNVLGDAMLTPSLQDAHIALYDIDEKRLKESNLMLKNINNKRFLFRFINSIFKIQQIEN